MIELNTCFNCNNNCLMCTSLRPSFSKTKLNIKELSSKEIKDIIDRDNTNNEISFTGGEPTIRKDIFELVEYAINKLGKDNVRILSNGRIFTYKDFTEKMSSIGLENYIIPIHAHVPELHDFITQTKNSFEQTLIGIKNLIGKRKNIEIRVVIHALNYIYLPQTAEFIFSNLKGISRVVFIYFDIIGSAFANRNRLIVKQKKVVPFLERAINTLIGKIPEVRTYHFPLCILNEKYHEIAKGVTVEERRIIFAKECEQCLKKDICPGIWKTYAHLVGIEEFKAIK